MRPIVDGSQSVGRFVVPVVCRVDTRDHTAQHAMLGLHTQCGAEDVRGSIGHTVRSACRRRVRGQMRLVLF
jgi:hypothetical protein